MSKMYVVTAKTKNGEWKYLGSDQLTVGNKINVNFSFKEHISKATFFEEPHAAASVYDRFENRINMNDLVKSTVQVSELKFIPKLKVKDNHK